MKNKLFSLIICFCLGLGLVSCTDDTSQNGNNNNNNGNIIDGIDISKYEMPQTDFLNDGHQLSKTEELMKYVIENGEFKYDTYSDGIGYKLILTNENDVTCYAFYSINYLRICQVKISHRTYTTSYVKISNNDNDEFNLMHKIVYNSYLTDFYAIMIGNKKTFNASFVGEYDLYRGDINLTKNEVTMVLVETIDSLFKSFNEIIGSKTNITLKDIGFVNY